MLSLVIGPTSRYLLSRVGEAHSPISRRNLPPSSSLEGRLRASEPCDVSPSVFSRRVGGLSFDSSAAG